MWPALLNVPCELGSNLCSAAFERNVLQMSTVFSWWLVQSLTMSILSFCILNGAISVSRVLRSLTTDSLFLLVILLCLLHLSWLSACLLGLLHLMGKMMSPLIFDSLLIQNKSKINPEALFQLVLFFTLNLYVSLYILRYFVENAWFGLHVWPPLIISHLVSAFMPLRWKRVINILMSTYYICCCFICLICSLLLLPSTLYLFACVRVYNFN